MKLLLILLPLLPLAISLDPGYPSAGFITIGSQTICPAYVCKSNELKTGCVTYSGSQILLEGCLDDWYCSWDSSPSSSEPYQFGKCITRQKHYKFRKNVNEFCYQNSDCKSVYCVQNKCSVKVSGSACTHNLECGKGMFCEATSDTCQFWLADGQKCTQYPSLCKPSSGCVSISGTEPVCTEYFSVNTESITNVYGKTFNSDKEDFCVSGSLKSSGACSETPYTLSGGYPMTCASSTDCTATGDAKQYTSCACFPNTAGAKYCTPFPGDAQDVQNRIKARLTKDFSNCYNYEIYNNENECGSYDLNSDRDWAPQIKAGTWGSCFDSVNLQVTDTPGTLNGQCPVLQCNDNNNQEGNCFYYAQSSHTFYVQACPNDYICGDNEHGDYQLQTTNVECKYGRDRTRLAHKDEWCWVDSDCFSGTCENTKICSVKALGQACTTHNECDRGLKCVYESSQFKYTCQSWIDIYSECTYQNYNLCRPGTACLANNANADTGTCRPYYSLTSGTTAYIMSQTGSYQSGYDKLCASGAWDSVNKICFGQSHKLSQFPMSCTENSDCKSVNSNEDNNYYSECACFPNTQGTKYCKAYIANIDSDYYQYFQNYFNQNLQNCFYYEIGNDYGGNCGTGSRYIDFWGESIPGDYFPSCGKDILYDEYRYQENQGNNLIYLYVFAGRLFPFISLLLVVLLVK